MTRCPNCAADLDGEYCARCGQRRIRPEELSFKYHLRDLIDEIATLHEKFKTIRTLGALFSPGFLTVEYLAGRRQRHLSPFKVYLVCAATFFLLAPAAGFRLQSMIDAEPSSGLEEKVSARAAALGLDRPVFNARFDARVQSVHTIVLGAVALVFALGLQVLFRRQRWPYGAHLILSLHYVSFMYLMTIVAGMSRVLGLPTELAAMVALGVIVPYLFIALKRVYAEHRLTAVWKGSVLALLTLLLNNAASVGSIALTLALVKA